MQSLPPLTPKEHHILMSVAQGSTASEIGEGLGISRRTALNYINVIRRKFGANTSTSKIVYKYYKFHRPDLKIPKRAEGLKISECLSQVLILNVKGKSYPEMAKILSISDNAVAQRMRTLKRIFKAKNRIHLGYLFLKATNPGLHRENFQ